MIKYASPLLVSMVLTAAGFADDTSFNFGWRFAKGDQAAAIAPDFDDAAWEQVDLPHDWAISGPFGALTEPGATGKLPWIGEGYYRKHFDLPAEAEGKRLQFVFDGVMANPTVYLNGQEVGSWTYGYNSFWIDATAAANFGGGNVLTVHADTRQHTSRWYPGAGIYRKVAIRLVDPLHIPVWGVCVTTPEVTDRQATVRAEVELTNSATRAQTVEIETTLLDPAGKKVAQRRNAITVPAGTLQVAGFEFNVPAPQRWDVDSPNLYQVATRLLADGQERQRVATPLGLRTFAWTADDGFHLNGRRVQLHGVNLHHGHGPLGAAFFPRAMERQLQIMKQMGVNAIRTSHNAPAPELLELCDRMGFVVWDELFDKYDKFAGIPCSIDEYVDRYAEREVVNFVRRDRNHPSIFTWSIGNEIAGLEKEHVDQMVAYFKRQDTTRAITLGSHIPAQASKRIIDALDTSGWNYAQKYMTARQTYPTMPLIYSESASAFGTRGAYKLNSPRTKTDWGNDGELNAHVLTAAAWADIPEVEFERMRRHPFMAGEFVWTGFDYLGEPTPYQGGNGKSAQPSGALARSSYFGIVDLAGLPKDSYHLYRSHWRPEEPTVHLAPHWNWEGHEGEAVPVYVYTNGDEAELFLNGRSLGRKSKVDPAKQKLANLAYGKVASASSEELIQDAGGNVQAENLAGKAIDGNSATRWCAKDGSYPQHWQVDLDESRTIAFVSIQWEKPDPKRAFELQTSTDGKKWKPVKAKAVTQRDRSELRFPPLPARGVRIVVNNGQKWASIREVEVLENPPANGAGSENPYFNVVDTYRIRWMEVPYAPGELKAVAYKNGKPLGEAVVRTAGQGAQLRLTADRTQLRADGMDLCYVTIDLLDQDGNLCPRAMDDLTFSVTGAA
uniref:glycoside hydrolase family 2 TIM barrel-domain containing protein n=1 Tax=Pontiella sp. TaxID=2837462 RepID=UPI0035656053